MSTLNLLALNRVNVRRDFTLADFQRIVENDFEVYLRRRIRSGLLWLQSRFSVGDLPGGLHEWKVCLRGRTVGILGHQVPRRLSCEIEVD